MNVETEKVGRQTDIYLVPQPWTGPSHSVSLRPACAPIGHVWACRTWVDGKGGFTSHATAGGGA